jgi:hypothetical protein
MLPSNHVRMFLCAHTHMLSHVHLYQHPFQTRCPECSVDICGKIRNMFVFCVQNGVAVPWKNSGAGIRWKRV